MLFCILFYFFESIFNHGVLPPVLFVYGSLFSSSSSNQPKVKLNFFLVDGLLAKTSGHPDNANEKLRLFFSRLNAWLEFGWRWRSITKLARPLPLVSVCVCVFFLFPMILRWFLNGVFQFHWSCFDLFQTWLNCWPDGWQPKWPPKWESAPVQVFWFGLRCV